MIERIISKDTIDTDKFLNMPFSSQCLYFHLSIRANNEGILNNTNSIVRLVGCEEKDLNILLENEYVSYADKTTVNINYWCAGNIFKGDF